MCPWLRGKAVAEVEMKHLGPTAWPLDHAPAAGKGGGTGWELAPGPIPASGGRKMPFGMCCPPPLSSCLLSPLCNPALLICSGVMRGKCFSKRQISCKWLEFLSAPFQEPWGGRRGSGLGGQRCSPGSPRPRLAPAAEGQGARRWPSQGWSALKFLVAALSEHIWF